MFFAIIFSFPTKGQLVGFNIEGNRKKTTFDFEIYNNLIIIPVVLDNRLPLRFILDTGVSSAILFDKKLTDLLGKAYARKISIMGVGEEQVVEAYVVTDTQIDLPGVKGYRQSLLVLDHDYLELSKQLGTEVHGIIGYELFSRFIVNINYIEKKITLYNPNSYKPRKRWETLDMDVYATKPFIKIPFSIGGKKTLMGNFLIDTGASHALLIHEDSNPDIYVPEKKIKSVLGKGLTGTINGHLTRINEMQLGKFKFNDVIVSFPDEQSYTDSLIYEDKNGTLGGEILSRFKVTFDYFDEKFYLKRTRLSDDDFEYNMSGIEMEAEGIDFDKLVVSSVREGSPGDSVDIRKGDVILSVNGLGGESLKLATIYKMFNSKQGRKVNFLIERDEERMRKKLILRKDL